MSRYSLDHVSDEALARDLRAAVCHERGGTAMVIAHIAEFDARNLYLPAAQPSMFAYCVHELRLSEDAAYKRIQAARAARRFPVLFEALADGRLHLAAICLLAPWLTPENADELIAAATHRTKAEIEGLLARRFPRSEAMGLVCPLPGLAPATAEPARAHVEPGAGACQLAPGQVGTGARAVPVAPQRFLIEVTIGRDTEAKLRYAQDLLGHALPSGDLARVFDRALDALIEKLERRKLGSARRPRASARPSTRPRHVPAQVRRAVWERDGGQCTFVSEAGHRCPARKMLEFDHVEEVARGGRASVAGIRLRCRTHNQYAAECTFGAGFMERKREEARRAAGARQLAPGQVGTGATATRAAADEELITPLRLLGFSAEEARRAAADCEPIREAPLEQRLRRALAYLRPRVRTVTVTSAPRAGAAMTT